MNRYLILGAGPIGRAAATALLSSGEQVTVGTRSGSHVPDCATTALDATDPERMIRVAGNHSGIIVCTNPPYHRWPTDWPPLIESVIAAAARTGCRVVLMGNLYPYGDPGGVRMRPDSPELTTEAKGRTRAEISRRLLAAGSEHGFVATELRASDYFGADAHSGAILGESFFRRLLTDRTCWIPGDADAVHSWSYLPDIGTTLAALATTEHDVSGRIWTGPSSGDASIREIAEMCRSTSRINRVPAPAIRAAGFVNPLAREVHAVLHQHTSRYVLDDSALRGELGTVPTPLREALAETTATMVST
ncbi:NAD-dependent epimerase/dehydratase family protein [Corynebacterium sp. CCM 9204]|uniref:NAD-dependent epimerase/dehydratase family protein n=1 Tax=Corynebacterium sp. CCM 9204 TaxID=3057616 RepID=UPI00352471C0